MIKKVVLTGGPGSGKTEVIKYLEKYYKDLNYNVIIIEESATYLINKGIKPFGNNALNMNDFEELILRVQFNNEDIVDRWINMLKIDNTLVICDRSVIDVLSFIELKDYQNILTNHLNIQNNYLQLLNRYDLVINLVGSKEYYTKENNPARTEDVTEALEKGIKNLQLYLGHNNLHIVLPKETIEEKANNVINIINENLRDYKEKRQEKYLINIDSSNMEKIKEISHKIHISQNYLVSEFNYEERVRKVEYLNNVVYYHNIYKLNDIHAIKVLEEEIDKNKYLELLQRQDINYQTIEKDRYYFAYEDEYLYLDIFEDFGILEINGLDDYYVKIPKCLDVIKKVTDDKKYSNKVLARKK